MIKGIGHVGVAVSNIDEVVQSVSKALGIPAPAVKDVPSWKIKVAVVHVGDQAFELLQDYSESGMLATFRREHGKNGIHHVCLISDDMEADIAAFKQRGVEMADEKPKLGVRGKRIAFTKPSVLGGVPIELSEP